MKITQAMVNAKIKYRIYGRSASDGRLYYVCSDFNTLKQAVSYKEKYCGKAINVRNDSYIIVKLVPEIVG